MTVEVSPGSDLLTIRSRRQASSGFAFVAAALLLLSYSYLEKEPAFLLTVVAAAVFCARAGVGKPILRLVGISLAWSGFLAVLGFLLGADKVSIVRDLFYFFLLPAGLLAGAGIGASLSERDAIWLTIVTSLVTASTFVFDGLTNPALKNLSRDDYRALLGYGSPLITFAIPCIFQLFRDRALGSRLLALGMTVLLAAAIWVADSRTQLGICLIGVLICFVGPRALPVRVGTFVGLILFCLLALPFYQLLLDNSRAAQLLADTPEFIREWIPFPYVDWVDINHFWRAYEGYQGYLHWANANIVNKLYGFGAGSFTSLGIEIVLGDKPTSSVPIFHNGFAYVLVKGGVVGLLYVFAMFVGLASIAFDGRRPRLNVAVATQVLIVVAFITSFPIITGFFNGTDAGMVPAMLFGLWWGVESRAFRNAGERRAAGGRTFRPPGEAVRLT